MKKVHRVKWDNGDTCQEIDITAFNVSFDGENINADGVIIDLGYQSDLTITIIE